MYLLPKRNSSGCSISLWRKAISQLHLNEPNTVLLTKDIASKYFGDWKTAIGKTMKVFGVNLKVTGVLENPPPNTDFPLGVVLSYETLVKKFRLTDWASISDYNYCSGAAEQ